MKTLKVLLTVLLTLLLVVTGFATQLLAAADLTVINPWFYKTGLSQMGFYENLRIMLLNQINSKIDLQEAIPEDFKEDAYKIAEEVITRERFSSDMGDFLGGTVQYVLRGTGDAKIPLKDWISELNVKIEESGIIDDIMDHDVSTGKLQEKDKELNYAEYKRVISATYTSYIGMYASLLVSSDSLTDLITIFAPTKEVQDKLEGQFWVLRYWTNRANLGAYVGLAVVAILVVLLFVVWRRNKGVAFKIVGIILMVNSVFFILLGIALLLSVTIANLMNVIPAMLIPFIGLAQSLINPLALIALGTGIILLVISIVLTVIGGALVRKKAEGSEEPEEPVQPLEVSEIEYSAASDVELISEEDSPEPEEPKTEQPED